LGPDDLRWLGSRGRRIQGRAPVSETTEEFDVLGALNVEAPDVVRLAAAVAIASRIEPFLLRRARLALCRGIDAGVELELWHSELVQAHSPRAMTLHPGFARELQIELRKSGKLDEAYALLEECHRHLPEAIRLEEEMTWRVLRGELASDHVKRLLRRATASLVEGGQPELAHWASRFLTRAPKGIHDLPEAWVLSLAASSRLGGARVLPSGELPTDVRKDELYWAIAGTGQAGTLYVGVRDDRLLLSLAAPDGTPDLAHPVPIPLTDPIIVEIDDGQPRGPQLHQLDHAVGQGLEIPFTGHTLKLTTVSGDVYEVAVSIGPAEGASGDGAAPSSALPGSPFPGLRPFEVDEAAIFFGRDAVVGEVMEKLEQPRLLAVVGPSGCGKSSLVRAGLIAALRARAAASGRTWRFVIMRPGAEPFRQLARALLESQLVPSEVGNDDLEKILGSGPDGLTRILRTIPSLQESSLLIVVDQFEELFRSAASAVADPFAELLARGVAQGDGSVRVAIGLRAEFLEQARSFRSLSDGLAVVAVPRLSRDGLRLAVAGPIRAFGGEIEEEVAERIIADLSEQEAGGQLPVLQFTLLRLWARASAMAEANAPTRVSAEIYAMVGGVRDAIARAADEALSELDVEQRRIAEILMRRLTDGSSRRPATLREVAEVAAVSEDQVVLVTESFRRPGLSIVGPPPPIPLMAETVLNLGHEAFVLEWPRLREWTRLEEESASVLRALELAARQWKDRGTDLSGGVDRMRFLDWSIRERPTAGWARRYGIDFSLVMAYLQHIRGAGAGEADEASREDAADAGGDFELEIDILAAGQGESLLITYGGRDRRFRVLVDCGPPSAARQLRTSLETLPPDQRALELMVLTHVDNDRIGAAVPLLRDRELAVRYRDIWFNGFRHLGGAETL